MKFIINNELVEQEQPEESKKCSHSNIIVTEVDGIKYRHCDNCGMKAHADGSYSHYCGFEWCRCSQ